MQAVIRLAVHPGELGRGVIERVAGGRKPPVTDADCSRADRKGDAGGAAGRGETQGDDEQDRQGAETHMPGGRRGRGAV
jgi:hypothetical protein